MNIEQYGFSSIFRYFKTNFNKNHQYLVIIKLDNLLKYRILDNPNDFFDGSPLISDNSVLWTKILTCRVV